MGSSGLLHMKPALSESVFVRLSLVYCSSEVEMLRLGTDSLFCSRYVLQHIKNSISTRLKLDFHWKIIGL